MKSQELLKRKKGNKKVAHPLAHFNSDTQTVPTRRVTSFQSVALMWFIFI